MISKRIKILLVSFVIVVFLSAIFSYFDFINIKKQNNTANNNIVLDKGSEEILKNREIGNTGEVTTIDKETQKEVPLVNPNLPAVITSTVGKIISIQNNVLTIQGTGSNFADGKAREITASIIEKTLIFDSAQKQYGSQEGVKILKQGLNVLVEGEGNIRGKTEFNILTLNILNY